MSPTKVAERVYLLDTMALGQENTVSIYVIKGPKVTLVDCGYASSLQTVLDGLGDLGIAPSDVRLIIPTHVHLDHAGAAGYLADLMPNAEVVAHEKAVPHLVDPTKLVESATRVFGKAIMELYGPPIGIPQERITAVGDEAHMDLGAGMTATLTHSPGHAPHQISMMLDGSKALLTADAVGILYPGMRSMIPTTPPPSFEPEALVATARKLSQFDPSALLIPHFGVRSDSKWVFDETAAKTDEWLRAIRALRNLGRTFDEITDKMVETATLESGLPELPMYAKISIRTSVMGITHYLDKHP